MTKCGKKYPEGPVIEHSLEFIGDLIQFYQISADFLYDMIQASPACPLPISVFCYDFGKTEIVV